MRRLIGFPIRQLLGPSKTSPKDKQACTLALHIRFGLGFVLPVNFGSFPQPVTLDTSFDPCPTPIQVAFKFHAGHGADSLTDVVADLGLRGLAVSA